MPRRCCIIWGCQLIKVEVAEFAVHWQYPLHVGGLRLGMVLPRVPDEGVNIVRQHRNVAGDRAASIFLVDQRVIFQRLPACRANVKTVQLPVACISPSRWFDAWWIMVHRRRLLRRR